MAYKRLGDLLTSIGVINEDQLKQALEIQKKTKKRLGMVLIESGILTEDQLIEALQMQLGVDFIDLAAYSIPPELSQVVSVNIARKHTVVPVKVTQDEVVLAMVDPLNFFAVEEVKAATHKRVVQVIARQADVERAIASLYGKKGAVQAIEELERESSGTVSYSTVTTTRIDEVDSASVAPSIRLVNSIIERAVTEQASDIHIEPRENGMVVRMRIDGVMRVIYDIPKNSQASVTARIKIMANLDIAERRVPQDGRALVRSRNLNIDLRISTLPTIYGEKIVIRLLNRSSTALTYEKIGLFGNNLTKFKSLITNRSGVVLLVGPTGSGKTSSLYTMIHDLNTEEVNLVTLEDPVEYNIEGINQVQINEKTGLTFASGLRSILRQDPDIIAVGEIRDGETAEIAMRAAITGHLVLSTLHTNDALSTIDRLIDIGVEPYLIASAVNGIISQRLLRKTCTHCQTEYTPDANVLRAMGFTADEIENKKFYHGTGCAYCNNSGYRGRIAVFEILIFNNEIKQLIHDRAPRTELIAAIERSGFEPITVNCRKLVEDSTTTAEEVFRVINTTADTHSL